MKTFKVVGINFDHMHMGDLLRRAFIHPNVEIAGICDTRPDRMASVISSFDIPKNRVFSDYRKCCGTEDDKGNKKFFVYHF